MTEKEKEELDQLLEKIDEFLKLAKRRSSGYNRHVSYKKKGRQNYFLIRTS